MKFTPPIKTLLKGDNAALHIRFAQSQLAILERQMSFQSLNEGRRVISPYDGVTVECLSSFGKKEIRVHVAGIEAPWVRDGLEPKQPERVRQFLERCTCYPFFSLGLITGVTPEVPVQEEGETELAFAARQATYAAFLEDGRFKYDAEICDGTRYAYVQDVIDANFGRYSVGQYVLATAGTVVDALGIPLTCSRACLLGSPIIELLMVSPIHILDGMAPDDKTIEI